MVLVAQMPLVGDDSLGPFASNCDVGFTRGFRHVSLATRRPPPPFACEWRCVCTSVSATAEARLYLVPPSIHHAQEDTDNNRCQRQEQKKKKFLPKSDCTSDHALTRRSRSTTAGVRQSSKRMIIIWDGISMSDQTGPTDPIRFHGVMIPLYHGIPLFGHCPFPCELMLSLTIMPDALANNRKGKGQTSRSPMQPPAGPPA